MESTTQLLLPLMILVSYSSAEDALSNDGKIYIYI